jgi:predicted ATPase/class 3 adenylate cyclase
MHALEERNEAELALGRHSRLIGELQSQVGQNPLRERLCGQLMLALYRAGRQAEASDLFQRTRERLVEELGMEPGPDLQTLLKRILQQDATLAAPAPPLPAAAPGLPSGTITFMLTDVEGSTRRWDRNPKAMKEAMAAHDEILGPLIATHQGLQVESGREGDSVMAAFQRPTDAIGCAVEMQRALAAHEWPAGADIHVRVSIHSGEAELRGGHYYGPAVYRCARLLVTGSGDQVLVSGATRDLAVDALPDGVTLRDLGSHRLRDLERPERVYQVLGSGMRAEFPPLRSMDPRRHNLPISPTRFIGREEELAEITERLASNRLLTLVGAGGTGKTRLALQAAADLIESFPDGVWLIELAPLTEPDLVAQTVAESLGVHEEAGRPVLRTLAEWLTDKRLLLIVDNCEHLVPAVVELADRILRDCAGVRLLATSREALRVNGEAIMKVGPLPETEAVILFAERSSAVQPAFRLTDDNASSVAQICRRVEGIPLAIELAAGRARMMAPAEILNRLQASFGVLAGGSRSDDSRHETLKAAVDWSYRLLTEDEKRFFRRVSVFMGGFTLEAAEAVCGGAAGADVLELTGQLVDKSLVATHEGESRQTRYSLLEAVREYGLARLGDHGELESAQRKHAEFYIRYADAATDRLTSEERSRWLLRLGDDVGNFRAIFDAPRLEPELAITLAGNLGEFWAFRGDFREGRERLESALSRGSSPSLSRVRALYGAALMTWAQGDHEAAARYCDESIALSRELGDFEGEARSLQQAGQIAIHREDYPAAQKYLNDALRIATRHGLPAVRSVCLWRLGTAAIFTGDLRRARKHLQASLTLSRELSDIEMVGVCLLMLGHVDLVEGRLEDSEQNLHESLGIMQLEGSSMSIANLLESLAAVAAAAGRAERALRLGGASEALRKRIAVTTNSPVHKAIVARLSAIRQGPAAEAEWVAGAQMSRQEAVDYALERVGPRNRER